MRLRVAALAAILLAFWAVQQVQAEALYVRNRPFSDYVNLGGQIYVPLEGFLRALGYGWTAVAKGEAVVVTATRGGRGGPSLTATALTLTSAGQSVHLEALRRGDRVYVPLRPLAPVLGFTIVSNRALGTVEVALAHPKTAAEIQAEQALEAARQAELARQKEQFAAARAERERRRREAEAAAAAAAGGEGQGPAAASPAPDASPGTTSGSPTPAPAASPAPSPTATPAATPSPSPSPPPEARLVVFNQTANPDYFTGVVTLSAEVRNQGYAAARNVRATVRLLGPDGSVWDTQRLFQATIPEDGIWNLRTTYTHPSGNAMPRGALKVQVDLDYDRR